MMALSTAQRATVKAYILATPDLANKTSGEGTDLGYIATALSSPVTPTFYVWRTSYSPEQIRAAITVNLGTAQLDALTAGKRDALLWFIGATINPSDPAVVATMDDFCGSQNTLKASLLNGAKRAATVAEKVLATGTGTLASAATMSYEGAVSIEEVAAILE
jgi:hypothetical protein